MKKLFLLLIVVGLMTQNSYAQTNRTVTGVLLDEKSEAMPFANVLLLKAADSTLAKAVVSDTEGNYFIENIIDNQYFIKVSMVGYIDFVSPLFMINESNKTMKFQPIKLQLSSTELKEVTVSVKKPFIEQHIDKTVLNVENSIVASGGTALEILEKAPGVTIDHQNEQIKLKNKTGVMVMIDGKKSYLSSADLTQMLKNMSSNQIASIEIITNPSSKYDASGNSGIINIKLKKNQSLGTNGSVSTSLGQTFMPNVTGNLWRASTNLNLNYRNEKWNLFGTLSGSRDSWYNDNQLNRNVVFENVKSVFNQYSSRDGHGLGSSFKVGADYFLSKKTTVGVMVDGNVWDGSMVGISQTSILATENSSLIQDSDMTMPQKNITTNFNIKHNFNEKGKELTFDIDYSGYDNETNQNFLTNYYDANSALTNSLLQRNTTPTAISITAAKIDLTLPLEKELKIEVGAKSGFVKTDNNFVFEYQQDNVWMNDAAKSNYFVYNENVNAAYINVGKQWKKWGVQGGLRAEHTHSKGNSITLEKVIERNYLSLFPTFFLNQNINKDHSVRYSYSRRIDRPNYQQLNPFLFFLDPYTYEEGNPFLQPQFTDNLEVSYTYKGGLSLSLGYSGTRDYMIQITEQDDATKVTKAKQINLQHVDNYSSNLSFPLPVKKWWMMQNQFSLYYSQFKDAQLLGAALNTGQLAYNFNTSSTFTLPKEWSAEASMWYNSPSIYGIFRNVKPQYAISAGVQKSFLKKKARLKLNINDIFLTSFWNGAVNYQNMDFTISNRWSSRRATLTFSYNFGNQNVKSARNRSTAADTEKNRVGGK